MAKVNDDIPVWNDAAAAEDVPVWNDSLDDTSKKKVSGKESEESSPLESPSQLPERLIPEGGDPFGIARTTSGTIIKDPVPFVKTPDEKPKVYDPALYSTKASDDLKRKHVTQNTLNKVVRDKFMGNQKLFSLGGNPDAEKAVDDFYAELSKSYTPEQIEATKVANQDLNQVRIPVRTASEKQKDEQKKLQDNGVSRWASTVGAIDEAFLVSAAQTLQSVGQMGMFGVDPEIQYSANPAQGVYKAGKWLEKKIKEMGFTNPKYAEDVLTQAATVLGQVGFYGLGGGVGVGAKAGISTAAKTVESIAAKDMARNAPAAFLAGSVNAASEYNVARERTEDANKLPLAEFVQKHAKGNTPEDVENAKNNFLDLQGKNPHDVAYDTWKRDLVAGALFNIAPVASIEKFDKISGGAIKRALVAGATGGVDGIIQESGMEMWNNATAQDYYEKTRSIGANLIETGEMGFLAQGTISALLAGISKGPSTPRTKRDLAYDAKTKEYLESLQQKLDVEQKEKTITVDAQGSLIEVNKPKEKATVPTPTPKADVGNEVVTEQVKDVKKEELKLVQPENTAPRLVVENLTKDSPVSDLPDGIAIDLNGEGGTISHAETGEVIFTNFDGKETIVTGGGDVSPLFMSNIKISEGYFTDKNGKYYVRRNKTGYDVFLIGAEGQLKPVYTNEKGNVERKNAIVRKALGGDPAVVNLEIKQSTLENDLLNPKTPDAAKPVIEQAIEQTQNDIEQAKQIAVDETIDAEMKQIDQDFAEGSIAELQAVIDDPSTSEQTKEAVKQEIKAIEAELPVVEKAEGGGVGDIDLTNRISVEDAADGKSKLISIDGEFYGTYKSDTNEGAIEQAKKELLDIFDELGGTDLSKYSGEELKIIAQNTIDYSKTNVNTKKIASEYFKLIKAELVDRGIKVSDNGLLPPTTQEVKVAAQKVEGGAVVGGVTFDNAKAITDYLPKGGELKGVTEVVVSDNGEEVSYGTKTSKTSITVKGLSADDIKQEIEFEKKVLAKSKRDAENFNEDEIRSAKGLTRQEKDDAIKMHKQSLTNNDQVEKIVIPFYEKHLEIAEQSLKETTKAETPQKVSEPNVESVNTKAAGSVGVVDVEATAKALENIANKNPDEINSLAEKTGVFFHGSDRHIKEFDPNMMSMDYGHYLSINPNVSEGYGDVLHAISIKDGLKGYLNMEEKASKSDLKKLGLAEGLNITGEEALIKSRNESGSKLSLEKYAESKGFKGEHYPSQKQITAFDSKTLEVKKSGEFKKIVSESISEAYHKAKADGTNPELVKAVEQSLKETPTPKGNTPNEGGEAKKQSKTEIERKQGFKIVNGERVQRQDRVQAVEGDATTIGFSKKDKQEGVWAVVDNSVTQPSHRSGIENPLHFLPEAQPRNRGGMAVLKNEAKQKADNLNPDELGDSPNAYFGAPVINERGEGVQGNGRIEAVDYYYKNYPDDPKGYREFVRKKAAALGIDVSSIEGMKNPVLVRIVKIDDARAIQLGNYKPSDLEDVVQRGGGAKADAGRMNAEQVDAVADMLIANDDGDMSLKDLIRKSGVKIIAKLQDIGVIRVDAKELYVDDKGLITQDGIDHLYGLFRAMIFKDASTQLETMFVALPSNIQKGVERSIVSILRLPDNKSILHEVQNAIAGLYEFNGFKEANSGRANFSQWASTADAFNPAPNTVYSPLELEIIKRLSNTTTQVAVSKMFNDYSDAVSDKAGNIFDAPVIGKSKSEGIKQVFNIDYDEKQIQDKQRGDQNGQRAVEPPKQPVAEKPAEPVVEENRQRQSPGEEAGDPEVLAESVTQDIESETEAIVEADNIEAVEQKLEDIEAIEDKIYPVKKKTKAEKLAAIDVNKETAKADLKKWLADKLSNKGNEGLDIKKMGGLDHDAIIDIVVDAVAGLIKAGIEVQDAINTVIATLKEGKMLDGFSEDRILDSVNIRLENSGDQVNKTFLTDRVYSSQTETHVKESIAKHGLTRNIIGHIISADIASQIIQDIGIKEAVKRVKNYEIDGGPAAEIIGHQIVDFSNKMERSVTPEEFNKWLEERTSLMVYMDARLLSGGQFASQMANIYETSEFNYTIERQIDEFKAVNKGEITPDQEAKLREIDKKYRAASKLVADLEEQMKQREEQVLVDNIKREIEYQGIIEALEKKAGNKKTSGRSLIKEGLSDLRAALGDRNNPLMMGVPVNNVLSALSKIGRGLIQEGVATVKNVAVKIKEYLDSSGIKGIDVGLYASDIEAKMSAEVAVSSTPDRLKIPYKKIRSIVEGGAEDIDSIVSELKNDYPDATDREIRDAVSGYGRTLDPNMDPVEVKLRKAKEAGRVMSAMEDVSVGKRPKKSGQQREKPTPEQRAARKKLKEYMKSLPIDLKTQENDLKNSLDRKKAAIKNRIEDLDREIKEGRKIDKDGKPNLTDKELTDLQEELRVMTRLHDERFVAENILEATQDAIAANEKRAKDLEDRISKGELVKDKPRSLIDQENKDLVASKEKVRELNDALRQLKEEAGILEEQRLRRAIAANERLIEDYNLRTKHQVVKKKKIRVINKHPVNDLLQKKLDDAILEKLYAKEEYDTMRHKQELKNRGDGQKLLDGSLEAWSLTRILMAGFEASFVFIQGAALTIKGAARYPFIIANRALRAFTKNEKMSFEDPSGVAEALRTAAKNFASEKAGEDWHKMLHKQEYYPELKDSNVEITKVDALQQAKDESYASGWIHHVWNMLGWPVAKPIELLLPRTEANKRWRNVNPMKALGRATDAYLNTLRVREFLRGREMLHKEGKTIKSDPGEFKALGDMVNTLTGRSKLGKLEFAAKGLSAVYFSPKNTYSVLKQTVFAPFWIPFGLHAKGTKWNRASAAQKLAVSNLMTYYTTVAAGVFLMGMARDDEDKPVFSIELDPTSTDFMSWTIGDRHYDPWSGRKQPIVLMARVLTEILTDKGGIKTLDGERKHIGADSKSTYWALIKRYFSNKMHPSATLSTRLADQIRKEKDGEVVYTDEYGNEVMNKEEALSYVTAMYWRSVWEVQQEDPVLAEQFLLATGFLGMPSAGVYGAAEPKVKIPPRRGGNKISAEEAQMNREMAKENREFARENRAERRTRDRDR